MAEMHASPKILFVVAILALVLIARSGIASSLYPIARVLDGLYDEFTFEGSQGQILYAELKSDIYQDAGRKAGSHDDTDGGCSDHDTIASTASGAKPSDSESSGCSCDDDSGGGHADICLQVLDELENKLCWAGRPARPGWQRDPQLVCELPEDGMYKLRVFIGQCGSENTAAYMDADTLDSVRFYKVYLELIDAAADGGLIRIPKQKK